MPKPNFIGGPSAHASHVSCTLLLQLASIRKWLSGRFCLIKIEQESAYYFGSRNRRAAPRWWKRESCPYATPSAIAPSLAFSSRGGTNSCVVSGMGLANRSSLAWWSDSALRSGQRLGSCRSIYLPKDNPRNILVIIACNFVAICEMSLYHKALPTCIRSILVHH